MGWWPFGGSSTDAKSSQAKSEFDEYVPPPPGSSPFAEPPTPPVWMKNTPVQNRPSEFSGFSDPPPVPKFESSLDSKKFTGGGSQFSSFPFKSSSQSSDYNPSELEKFASPYSETSGLDDDKYLRLEKANTWEDRVFTSQRSRACFERVKMGIKMGAAVGGIFGGLTGLYASVVHRNVLILPLSIVGGGVSFGFFLGCGMIVRCESLTSKNQHFNRITLESPHSRE
ncbi:hypothetical protein IE077_003702 [Cardiosporidium cionae]|uniref:Reactive oxygen species modulator 1 n=1 Tax=Cardiosporidium cionae TaxID=476202 RepID=A0ABQ7JEQ5_9APIC|nr:hypothetical protein IE077_003702 [Cardiosporidium cionae]|eukprot:KAF8822478.1 hypothetical protein IE077_003702 [Cardiosporidium cionae]